MSDGTSGGVWNKQFGNSQRHAGEGVIRSVFSRHPAFWPGRARAFATMKEPRHGTPAGHRGEVPRGAVCDPGKKTTRNILHKRHLHTK